MEDESDKTGDSNVFNVELNEIKQLVLKFGDGITTRKLTPNSELYVLYLECQGMDGEVNPGEDNQNLEMTHSASMLGISDELY